MFPTTLFLLGQGLTSVELETPELEWGSGWGSELETPELQWGSGWGSEAETPELQWGSGWGSEMEERGSGLASSGQCGAETTKALVQHPDLEVAAACNRFASPEVFGLSCDVVDAACDFVFGVLGKTVIQSIGACEEAAKVVYGACQIVAEGLGDPGLCADVLGGNLEDVCKAAVNAGSSFASGQCKNLAGCSRRRIILNAVAQAPAMENLPVLADGGGIACTIIDKACNALFSVVQKAVGNVWDCFLSAGEAAAACEVIGLGPEDPLADVCALALGGIVGAGCVATVIAGGTFGGSACDAFASPFCDGFEADFLEAMTSSRITTDSFNLPALHGVTFETPELSESQLDSVFKCSFLPGACDAAFKGLETEALTDFPGCQVLQQIAATICGILPGNISAACKMVLGEIASLCNGAVSNGGKFGLTECKAQQSEDCSNILGVQNSLMEDAHTCFSADHEGVDMDCEVEGLGNLQALALSSEHAQLGGPIAAAACWAVGMPACISLGPMSGVCLLTLGAACAAALAAPTP